MEDVAESSVEFLAPAWVFEMVVGKAGDSRFVDFGFVEHDRAVVRGIRPVQGGTTKVVLKLIEWVVISVNAIEFAHRQSVFTGVTWLMDFVELEGTQKRVDKFSRLFAIRAAAGFHLFPV